MVARTNHKEIKNTFYQPYAMVNLNSVLNRPSTINGISRKFPYPTIGIYCGQGASHSWLWFVDILDAMGFWDMVFVDAHSIKTEGLSGFNALLVSGGDTFAIAEALGEAGAHQLTQFLNEGGLYIGSCAGAYLPLHSSVPPLNFFNYVPAKISNLTKTLACPQVLPEKFCTPYGCRYVFHPVREEVNITVIDFPSQIQHHADVNAPIYGGPAFLRSEDVHPVALYSGFTPKTLYLTDPQLAYDTIVGKAAIITVRVGKGTMYLAGPHLEHPHYHAANTLIAEMLYRSENCTGETIFSPRTSAQVASSGKLPILLRNIKSELSNSRIAALALERTPVQWQIGSKIYEPEKIRVFLEAMWSRWNVCASQKSGNELELHAIYGMAQEVTQRLRAIQQSLLSGTDDLTSVKEMFGHLKQLTASFLTIYCTERRTRIMNGGTT